jgi:hypothetical protein
MLIGSISTHTNQNEFHDTIANGHKKETCQNCLVHFFSLNLNVSNVDQFFYHNLIEKLDYWSTSY